MDPVTLTPAQAEFLAGRHFAAVATLDDDGAPRQSIVWYRLEPDGRILLNSRHPRRWPRNLLRDGRTAIAIPERSDPAPRRRTAKRRIWFQSMPRGQVILGGGASFGGPAPGGNVRPASLRP